jgi:hypothetical protein
MAMAPPAALISIMPCCNRRRDAGAGVAQGVAVVQIAHHRVRVQQVPYGSRSRIGVAIAAMGKRAPGEVRSCGPAAEVSSVIIVIIGEVSAATGMWPIRVEMPTIVVAHASATEMRRAATATSAAAGSGGRGIRRA